MNYIFQSATIKLTAWYLLILMTISLLFSIIIYRVAESEIKTRLESLQLGLIQDTNLSLIPGYELRSLRSSQAHEAALNLFISLVYINIFIFIVGGLGSYVLARRTLRPIELSTEAQLRFTSDASHELRTPLAVMKTELEVALRQPSLSSTEFREVLKSNLEEVNTLSQLSHTLLQLSRIENATLPRKGLVVNDIIAKVIRRYDRNGKRIHFTYKNKKCMIAGDEVSIEELFTILIDNALKYSSKKSIIHVELIENQKQYEIKIVNKGKGIAPKHIPYIFNRFYRADSSRTKNSSSGYGLGLSLAKEITALHNGHIRVQSDVNKLTTFSVSLPVYNPKGKTS